MVAQRITRLIITAFALALLGFHLYRPEQRVDFVAVALLVVAATPWLHHVFESIEASTTGVKVTYVRTKGALDDIAAGVVARAGAAPFGGQAAPPAVPGSGGAAAPAMRVMPEPESAARADAPRWLKTDDPNLALVALRIEIERRLRALGDVHGIERWSLAVLLHEVARAERFDDRTVAGLRALIEAGNKAAHGAKVDADVLHLVREEGPAILGALDGMLRARG